MRVAIDIGSVVVRTDAERHRLDRVAPAVQEAFRELAKRLDNTPGGRWDDWPERIALTLEAGTIPLDELLSPRGAERLADQWYRQLMEQR